MSSRRGRNSSRQHIVAHANDVLNGRGVKIAQHPGNLRFRSLVKEMQDERYCENFSSSEKKALAREIINHIKHKLNPPGRFLKRHGQDGPWVELTVSETEKKTKQALRDCNRNDRTGYAKQVTAPLDVERADRERKRTGLTLQEHARKQVDEETRKSRSKGGNGNRKTPPTSGAALRSSRRSVQGALNSTGRVEKDPYAPISNPETASSMRLPFQHSMEPANIESSTSAWAAAPATVNATPATARPYTNAAPVTQTPNPSTYSYAPSNGHDHHQLNHPGSQQSINSHRVATYHDHYASRHTFPDHHPSAVRGDNSVARFPSPIVRSPIVPEATQNDVRAFDGQHEPFLDDWTGHPRHNLFPSVDTSVDPLDSLAASASASLANDRSDEDFMPMLTFGNANDVSDVLDN